MKAMKALKIIGLSLLSIIVLSIVVALIAIWIIFTPNRLTPIVRNNADRFISCEYELGSINLTLIKTFPQFGIEISDLLLKNPVQGAQSDTLLYLEKIVAAIDISVLLENREIVINEIYANNVNANLFWGNNGISNIDIFKLASSENEQEESAKEGGFNIPIDANKVGFYKLNLSYLDAATGLQAEIDATDVEIDGKYREGKGDGKLNFSSESVAAAMLTDSLQLQTQLSNLNLSVDGSFANNIVDAAIELSSKSVWANLNGDNYLSNIPINISLPVKANIGDMSFNLANASLELDKLGLQLDGDISANDNIEMDIDFAFSEFQIADILPLIPSNFSSLIEGIDIDGLVALSGSALGSYNDTVMPIVEANLRLSDSRFSYTELPISLTNIAANVDATIDLNSETATNVTINQFAARTAQSSLSMVGKASELLSDNMKIDVDADLQLVIEEFANFLPDNIISEGDVVGNIAAKLSMQQLVDMDLEAMDISGNLSMTNFGAIYNDTISVAAENMGIEFVIPNNNPLLSLAKVNLYDINSLDVAMGSGINAAIDNIAIDAELSNMLKDTTQLSTSVTLEAGKALVNMENIEALANNLSGNADIYLNLADSIAMPKVSGAFALSSLSASMDTISANIESPNLSFSLEDSPYSKGDIGASLDWSSGFIDAAMGDISVNIESIHLNAIVAQDLSKENPISQWHPEAAVNLVNGSVFVPQLNDNVSIPAVIFDMDDNRINITDGSFIIGESDFRLSGQIYNVENYLENPAEELLTGELDFTSRLTDVNYFMDLTNGFGAEVEIVDEEELAIVEVEESVTEETDSNNTPSPFMVPMGVNFVLNTNIEKALVGRQECYNLGGRLYVNDGVLILEEMGFISQATELQLTAIYKSPRKNHLYLGIDYHMLDIDIDELLEMIPDIDTIMPMLKAFHGSGEFHLAAETYLNENYELKMSTLRGACSITGNDLVVLENDVFNKIKKLTLMGRKTENKIENINAEITVFRDEVDVYPLMVSMGRYQAILGGRHNLDMSYNYHLSLTKSPLPMRLGVNIFTKPNKEGLKIRLARCRYAADYRPGRQYAVDNRQRELRQIIRESLTSGVVRE